LSKLLTKIAKRLSVLKLMLIWKTASDVNSSQATTRSCSHRSLETSFIQVCWTSSHFQPGAAARSNYSPADVFSIGETNFSLLRLFMNWVRH